MIRKQAGMVFGTAALILSMSFSALAEVEPGDIISYTAGDKDITVYVANPAGKGTYELDCQIGTKRPQAIESHLITEDPVSVKTVILVDNSLSVRSEYRDKITEILETLLVNHAENEQYTVACFSDKLDYLITDSSDYGAVKEKIENITYKDQETYLTDVLYELLTELEKDNSSFYRIIVISDGVDNKSIGYTKDELNEKLKERPVPLFMIGCTSKNNEEQLKNMFALSRSSKGEAFLMDDLEDITDFVRSVKETDHTVKAVITPEQEDLDGTNKGILVTFSTDDGTAQSSFNVDMPFAELAGNASQESTVSESAAETAAESSVPEEIWASLPAAGGTAGTEITESKAAETIAPEETVKIGGQNVKVKTLALLSAAAVASMLIAGVVVLIVVLNKRKKRRKQESTDPDDAPTELISDDDSPTEMIDDDDVTMMVEPTLVLRDEHNPDTEYSAELTGTIVVGRRQDCDIVIPEKTVSRQQFEVGMDGGTVWIRNLSDHGTMADGERVAGMQELHNGSRITIGNLTLTVEIR